MKFKWLYCLLASFFIVSSGTAQTNEFRGFWVDAWGNGFLNASQVSTLVNHCRTYHYNAIVVQMRRRGDAFYMPQAPNLEPRTTAVASNFDALQELINQCNTGSPKIEVHCWTPTFLVGDSSSPSNPNHVMNLRPQYLMKNSAGQTFIGEGYYLDPGNPEAQTWNYNMAMDIVSRYNVTGYHWDYIRYPTTDSGYNDVAIARYNAEYGLTGQPSTTDSQFSNWRRRQVTDFLRWANADLLAVKTNLVISASVFGSRSDAYNARFQDWATWNNEGIIDICMPMGYTDDFSLFTNRVNDAYNNQGVRRVYMGQGAYLNTKEDSVAQLNYIRTKGLLGKMFYSYRVPNSGTVNQTATFTYVRDNHQPSAATVPTLPWKASPTKGILKGTITRQDTGAVVYNATVTITGRSVKSEGHGKYVFYETTPGTYTVTATGTGLGSVSTNVTVVAGQVITANLVFPNDTTPPVISNVAAGNVTDTAATITWTTDESSSSTVQYGPTISYGSSVTDTNRVLNHTVSLTDLDPSTTYHFRVRSTDANTNEAVSADFTFTTNPSGVVNDVIVESRTSTGSLTANPPYSDSGFADSTLKSTAAGLSGTGSRYAISGTPSFSVKPTLSIAGASYDVYLTHGVATSISDNITVAVGQSGCTGLPASTTIFRESNGNTWELLGRLTLNPGQTSPTLTFTYSSGTLGSSSRMYSDAVKFVYVPTAPSVDTPPQTQTANYGGSASFTVQASGTTPFTYQWRKGVVNLSNNGRISGANTATLVINDLVTSDAGSYNVIISNYVGSATSASATLSIREPVINTQPATQTVDFGSTVHFSVAAVGTGPLSYQWRKGIQDLSDIGNVSGSGTATLTLSNVTQADAGNYSVVVTNPNGTTNSATAVLTVDASPNITGQPQNRTDVAGATATFSVTATGVAPMLYQWRKNGSNMSNGGNVSGASSATLTISNVSSSDAASYSVVVTNAFGSDTSASATLTVISPPVITSHPASRTNTAGTAATFTVTASGSSPSYQWYKDGALLSNAGNISGATTATLTVGSVSQTDAAFYTVVVSNLAGTVTSNPAELAVNDSTGEQVIVRSRTTLGATTSNPPYRESAGSWANSSTNSTAPGVLNGGSRFASTNTVIPAFQVIPTLSAAGAQYLVEVTHTTAGNNCSPSIIVAVSESGGSGLPETTTAFQASNGANSWTNVGILTLNEGVTTPTITFTYSSGFLFGTLGRFYADAIRFTQVALPPSIASAPASRTNIVGTAAAFTVLPSGTGPFTYQWKKNGVNLSNGGNVSGATTRTLSLSDVSFGDAANYSVVVSNSIRGVTSPVAALVVVDDPVNIQTHPASSTVAAGTMASFSVAALGTSLTYQWQKNGDALSDGDNISGATAATLNIADVTQNDAASYRVLVSNSLGTQTSSAASLTVVDPPVITVHPLPQVHDAGTNVTFSVAATGTAPFTYQWFKDGEPLSDSSHLNGATADSITITNVLGADAGIYTVTVGNSAGLQISDPAALTVNDPIILSQPVNASPDPGQAAIFSVQAYGTEMLAYQWKKGDTALVDGGNITGANAATLTLSNVQASDVGSYSVIVTSEAGGSITSSVVSLTLGVPPTIVTQPVGGTYNINTNATLTVVATGGEPLAYQWQKNGTNISNGGGIFGVTTPTLTFTGLLTNHAGPYRVIVSNSAGTNTSAVAVLNVNSDLTKPTVVVTYPLATTYITNITSIVGTANDASGIAEVLYSLNSSNFTSATMAYVGPGKPTNFTVAASAQPGTNVLVVKATDKKGNQSLLKTVKFYYHVPSPFTFSVNGEGLSTGTITSYGSLALGFTTNNAQLFVGRSYKIRSAVGAGTNSVLTNITYTAVGESGQLFTNLTALVSVTLNFTMKSNLHLNFNYIENPLRRYGGNYYGLVSDTNNGVSHASSGYLNLNVTPQFTYSGKLLIGGNSVSVSGKLPIDGKALNRIASRAPFEKTNLAYSVEVDLTGQHKVTGLFSDPNAGWTSVMEADRLVWHGVHNPATAWTNKFTAVVPGFTNKTEGPTGFMVARPTVVATGRATFTGGSIGDFEPRGTWFAPATFISKEGYWPLFHPLYYVKRELQAINPVTSLPKTTLEYRGLVIGWLQLTTNHLGNLRPEGEVSWIKTGWTNVLYPNGFTNLNVPMIASRWMTPTQAGQYPITGGTTNWQVTLSEGTLATPYVFNAYVYTNRVQSVPGQPNTPTVNMVKSTGEMSGSFLHPATFGRVSFVGVALQDLNYGRGWFIGPTEGGAMTFAPKP